MQGTLPPSMPPVYLTVLDFDPLELARQITLHEQDLFQRVQARELLDQAWLSKDKETLAPGITVMTKWSTRMSRWAVTEILTVDSPKGRAAVYERFVAIVKVRASFGGAERCDKAGGGPDAVPARTVRPRPSHNAGARKPAQL